MKILISDAFDTILPGRLAEFGTVTDNQAEMVDAEVILIRSKTKCTREYIDQAAKLRLIIRGGVGLDNVDVPYARSKGIQVFNTAEASAISVAELAFALMIAVPTRLVDGHFGLKDRKFLKSELKRTELLGKTLGLIGAGNIGTELAKRAQAFGMKVIAYDPLLRNHQVVELKSLEAVLAESDYLSLHVPLIDSTRCMIDGARIAAMKKGVIIVNTARGGCVAEADLVEALKSGQVRAYATDVFPSDPPPDSWPLYDAPNVIMTPHLGASSKENMGRIGEVVVRILRDFVAHTA
jgi:D-3-phosphoglycerate dehydrogenase